MISPKQLKRFLILVLLAGVLVAVASCSATNDQPSSNAQPTSYVPETPVPEPDYSAHQAVEMSGMFVEIEGAMVFQSGGEGGSPIVLYNLDLHRWSTAVDFVKASGDGEPRATVRGYLLNNGKLAVCRAEEIFVNPPALVVDDCSSQ